LRGRTGARLGLGEFHALSGCCFGFAYLFHPPSVVILRNPPALPEDSSGATVPGMVPIRQRVVHAVSPHPDPQGDGTAHTAQPKTKDLSCALWRERFTLSPRPPSSSVCLSRFELAPGFGVRRQSAATTALWISGAAVLTLGSGVARAPNPKRRGASLPAALQNVRGMLQQLAQFCVGWGGALTL